MNESFVVNPSNEGFEIEQERFECGVCNFTSRFKSNVRRHERRHLTEGSDPPGVEDGRIGILCDQCARPFKTKRGLKLHVHTKHLNIFRFKCSVCPSQFNMLSAFRGHLASHHRELKEKCAQCGAAFHLNHYLFNRLNRLIWAVQMSTHNLCFEVKIIKKNRGSMALYTLT